MNIQSIFVEPHYGGINPSAVHRLRRAVEGGLPAVVLRNIRRVAALEAVGNFIFFITKVLISATCALACFVWMGQYYREETHSITYPTLLVAAMAFHLGAIFVGVVDMVADTLLICFIADEEIYGEGDDNCFATPGLRGYIEGHPNHVNTPKAGGDKGDDKL